MDGDVEQRVHTSSYRLSFEWQLGWVVDPVAEEVGLIARRWVSGMTVKSEYPD